MRPHGNQGKGGGKIEQKEEQVRSIEETARNTVQELIDLAHQEEGETWKDYVEQKFGKHPLAEVKEPLQRQEQVPHHIAYGSHWGHTTLLLTTNTRLHSPPKGSVQ